MSTARAFIQGSAWMMAMRWVMRLMGLVSTIILARLLVPEDFGLVAMAATVAGLLQALTWTGVDLAIIQNRDATRSHYDTAWSIQIIQGVLICLLLLISAPFAADYFKDERVATVMYLFALQPLIEGFENIGIVAFRKDLDFAKDFRFSVAQKLLSVLTVIGMALWLRNYWALVAGQLAGAFFSVALSYRVHPYRPRWNLSEWHSIWSFSQWLLISRVGGYLGQNVDKFIVGGMAGTAMMGSYHVAKELSALFVDEVVMPIRRSLFPNFAKIAEDKEALKNVTRSLVGVVATACFAVGFGLSAVAEDFVLLILGDKWTDAIPLVAWLAVFAAFYGVAMGVEIVLHVCERGKLSAVEAWLRVIVLTVVLAGLLKYYGILEMVMARPVIAAVFLPLLMAFVASATGLRTRDLLLPLARPLIAATAMLGALSAYDPGTGLRAVDLLLDILAGGAVYSAVLLASWVVAGRPEGMETFVIKAVSGFVDRRRSDQPS